MAPQISENILRFRNQGLTKNGAGLKRAAAVQAAAALGPYMGTCHSQSLAPFCSHTRTPPAVSGPDKDTRAYTETYTNHSHITNANSTWENISVKLRTDGKNIRSSSPSCPLRPACISIPHFPFPLNAPTRGRAQLDSAFAPHPKDGGYFDRKVGVGARRLSDGLPYSELCARDSLLVLASSAPPRVAESI